MYKVKLLTNYKDISVGTIYESDKEKCEQLVSLGRAVWVEQTESEQPIAQDKEMRPRRNRRGYETK